MSVVGCFCPMAKIFQPRFEVKNPDGTFEIVTTAMLMRDPERIRKEEKFSILIERSIGDVKFWYGEPRYLANSDLVAYATGGIDGDFKQETDFSGLVEVPLDGDTMGELMAQIAGGQAAEGSLTSRIKGSQQIAREISEKRVMRQIRTTLQRLKKERERLQEEGKGNYTPSPVEFLCTYALASEETTTTEELKKITDSFNELMSKVESKSKTWL